MIAYWLHFCSPVRIKKQNQVKEQFMSEQSNTKVYLVTGVRVAVDEEHRILIAGMLSESPFTDGQQESALPANPIYNFAFTRQHATFLRDRLDEFLKEEG